MNHLRAVLFRFDHPLKAYWMIFRHVRAHDQNHIGVQQIFWRRRSPASTIACAQTGHSRAMSYPGLVAYANHAQTSGEKFFDQVIFFVVERGATEMSDGRGLHQALTVF